MKLFYTLLFILSISLLNACVSNKNNRLIGTWEINKAMTKETFSNGENAGDYYHNLDSIISNLWVGGTLQLNKNGTAHLGSKDITKDFDWQMDEVSNNILELKSKGANNAEIIFMPVVNDKLFYLEDKDVIYASMVFTQDNSAIIVEMSKTK